MSYAPATDPMALAELGERGRVSVYAQGGDYHKTVKKALKALARFIVAEAPSELKVFVDTAPVMIRNCLIAAGNSRSIALAPSIEPHLSDANPVVAEAAAWALERLQPRSSDSMQAC